MPDEGLLPQVHSDGQAARDQLRASHEDRDEIVERLRVAGGDGRLDADELDERVGAALAARTYGELAALVTDLPSAPGTPAAAVTDTPKEVVRIHCGSGSAKRAGRWLVPARMEVRVESGSMRLNFTEAEITGSVLHIDAEVGSGSLVLITRPGILVDAGEMSVGSGTAKVKAPWNEADYPVRLRISVSGSVKSGTFKARPARRSLWGWLSRGPRPYALPAGRN